MTKDDEVIHKHCQCPVCLQVLAVPVTWPCGHSFCKSCSFLMVKDFSDKDTGRVKCPTCRDDNRCSKIEKLQTSLVLQELLVYVFGEKEIKQRECEVNKAVERLEAILRGPTAEDGEEFHGENSGQHDQGWQVIVHADEYNLTKDGTVTVERNIVRDNDRFAHRIALAPVANPAYIPTSKKHFSSWKMKFVVLEMEVDEMEDSGGFPPAISLPGVSFLENAVNDDDQLIRTSFASDVLYCTVTMDGNELGEVESFETLHGVVSFYFGDLFENVQVDYGAQIKLHVTSEEEGMSCIVRYTFEKPSSKQQQSKKFWLKREHRMDSSAAAASTRSDEEDSEDSDEQEEREYVEHDDEDDEDSSLDDFIVDDEDEEVTYKKRGHKSRHVEKKEEPQRGGGGGKKRRIVAVSDDDEEEDDEDTHEPEDDEEEDDEDTHEPEDDEYGERDHSNDDDDDEEDDRKRFLQRLDEEDEEDEL